MIDSHIHLASTKYSNDLDQIFFNLKKHNVEYVINIGTDIKTSKLAISQSHKYKYQSYATVGVHPEEINSDVNLNVISTLEKLIKDEVVVAVGEVGLDKTYIKNLPKEKQQLHFTWQKNWLDLQIQLARQNDYPLILHSRETTDEMLKVVNTFQKKIKFVWHCFTENTEVARLVIENGGYLSFTGIVTYKNVDSILDVIKYVPKDRYMIETDGPYLVPEPLRKQGTKLNMPWNVFYVAEKIAKVKGESVENVIKQTINNTCKFFKI